MSGTDGLFHDKHSHPFVNNIFIVFADKCFRDILVFGWHGFDALFMSHVDVHKFTILYD